MKQNIRTINKQRHATTMFSVSLHKMKIGVASVVNFLFFIADVIEVKCCMIGQLTEIETDGRGGYLTQLTGRSACIMMVKATSVVNICTLIGMFLTNTCCLSSGVSRK